MDAILGQLAQYGLLGIILALAFYAIIKLFNLYTDTQEKRIAENRQQLEVIQSNTTSNDNNTAAIKALGDLIKAQKGG